MGAWKVETLYFPEEVRERPDYRASFRNVVGGRLRRRMERVAEAAAANTPFPAIAERYRVVQESAGDVLTFRIENDSEIFPFVENDTVPHWPPPGALLPWMESRGIPEEASVVRCRSPRTGRSRSRSRCGS
jgi:hypothetical protein